MASMEATLNFSYLLKSIYVHPTIHIDERFSHLRGIKWVDAGELNVGEVWNYSGVGYLALVHSGMRFYGQPRRLASFLAYRRDHGLITFLEGSRSSEYDPTPFVEGTPE